MTLPAWWLSVSKTSTPATENLWQSLRTRLDISKWKPAQADNVITRELHDRTGTYYVLKNSRVHTYLRLSPREYWVWQRLDGTHTAQELIVQYFQEHKVFAYGLVIGLVQHLFEKQMLDAQPEFILTELQRDLRQRALLHKLFNPERGWLTRQFNIPRFDDHMTRVYRAGAWIFFTRLAFAIFFLLSIVGAILFTQILGDDRFRFIGRSLGVTLLLLYLIAIVPIALHELAHALAIKHYQREAYRGGLMLRYGLPAAFVDLTDILLESKRPRVLVTLAGPFTSILIASVCALWLWFARDAAYAPLLFQIASIGFFISFVNLNPALELDGYYILSDALEIPRLRERSLAFFRHTLFAKLLKRERWTRDEIIFLLFGAMTAAWIGYSIYLGYIIYHGRLAEYIQSIRLPIQTRAYVIALIVIASFGFVIILRNKIFAMARRVAEQIHRAEQTARAEAVALAILGVAALAAFAPLALVHEMVEWLDSIVGVAAITVGVISAARISQEMQGALAARAWQLVALALSLVGAAHIFWGVTFDESDQIAYALDFIALGLASVAAVLLTSLLLGLRGSWRFVSAILLGLGWLSLLGTLRHDAIIYGVAIHLFSILLLVGGLAHWQMARHVLLSAAEAIHAQSSNEQIIHAFQLLAESACAQTRGTFGTGGVQRVESRFNTQARKRDWGIHIKNGKVDFSPSATDPMPLERFGAEAEPVSLYQMSASDLADLIAAALSVLLFSIAKFFGENFARTVLARGYDALSWDAREVIAENVLPQTRYAEGLAEQFAQARQDAASLLQRAPLFADFTRDELHAVGERLRIEHFARGEVIIRQGDPGDRFYILRRGSVEVRQRDAQGFEQVVNRLESGDYFGETALLTGAPRNATIRALTSVSTFTLDKKSFDQLVRAGFRGRDKMDAAYKRVALLRRIPVFTEFDNFELKRVAGQLESSWVDAGQEIFAQGDAGDKFYVIESGEVAVQTRGAQGETIEHSRLGAGEYFGEIALLMNMPRTATIIALKPTELLAFGADAFNDLVRQSQFVSRALERAGSRRMLLLARGQ